MLHALFFNTLAGSLGLWLSAKYIPGVAINNLWQTLAMAGLSIGLINTFFRPVINILSWPLRILTFGLASIAINMFFMEAIDILFASIQIKGIIPLFLSTLIISGSELTASLIFKT